ncbi:MULTISPECIES: ABC transporter permease [Bradyrhizobium]|uniref:ABC transporter permease n=3 Tax=Bradyrhizobium TaxID=374 RepID=A0AAE5X8C0_9BRAD|nr:MULTISPECIES: ABC transporter permease [Bradyrhizobium]MCG2629319.1 ABC transporter permease [Bradyrhizobium zhengyangense]MCG2644600.1 ABC transporter permease [Bradyrhizobium zhengyangense]MCG2670833.1 ABC transporter permease [Bradyrhizobium zhengyangense]MDN4984465.1 ABC transporter permease [Bradyrhizobium sp. WYCCWR 13022]MDN5002457.1 ABC transporter permease [Bradyrhizobium sp. WYCCWR 12677]
MSNATPSAPFAGVADEQRLRSILYRGAASAFLFALPIIVFLLIWETTVRLGWINATILPSPSNIARRAWVLLDPADPAKSILLTHIVVSLWRALSSFALACVLAIPMGLFLGLNRTAYLIASPLLSLLLPLPAVAWAPIFLVIFGQGDITIIAVCFLGAFFPILYSTIQGVRAIGRHSLWVVRSMGASRFDIFRRVLLPGALPALISGLKLGMAHSWRTLVAAEMLAALTHGLGFMIFAARSYMDVSTMFVGIVCLALIGLLIERGVFGSLEALTIHRWHGNGKVGSHR